MDAYYDAHEEPEEPEVAPAPVAEPAPTPPPPPPPAAAQANPFAVPTQGPPPYGSPAGSPPGYGAPAPDGQPQSGTDGFAVTSLVLSLLGFALIAVVFGVVALRRIARTQRAGRGLAIAGIVIGAITTLLYGGAVLAGVLGGAERNGGGAVTSAGDVSLDDLRVRDCTGALPESEVLTLRVVPCTEPHTAEVFATFPLEGDRYPGDADVTRFAEGGCDRELGALLGDEVETTPYELFYFSPTEQSWRLGDRTVICLLTAPPGETLTGSVVERAGSA